MKLLLAALALGPTVASPQQVPPGAQACPPLAADQPARVIALFLPFSRDTLRARRLAGAVDVDVEVTCEGEAERSTVRVVSAVDTTLQRLAWDAVAYAVFVPARAAGRPVRSTLRVPVVFDTATPPRIVTSPDTVEQRPAVLTAGPLEYPPALRVARISGRVVLQFIVDTVGRLEPSSLVIVQSPEPAMSAAAVRAAFETVFQPARTRGHAVRVLVNLPFDFNVKH